MKGARWCIGFGENFSQTVSTKPLSTHAGAPGHGNQRPYCPRLPPAFTDRANSRSRYLGFALWQTASRGLPDGKSEILRATICSICEGWWWFKAARRERTRYWCRGWWGGSERAWVHVRGNEWMRDHHPLPRCARPSSIISPWRERDPRE